MKSPYTEVRRYVANAEDLLQTKAGRENGLYKDKKYVRRAGDTAWKGVLMAVEEWLKNKGIVHPEKKRPSKERYQVHLSKKNCKLNSLFVAAYKGLHLYMGYDGNLIVKNTHGSLELARHIISFCDKES